VCPRQLNICAYLQEGEEISQGYKLNAMVVKLVSREFDKDRVNDIPLKRDVNDSQNWV
jgi:hypothetical protein